MSEPYWVLDSGELSVRCRACPWRSDSLPVMSTDQLTFRTICQSIEADWRAHRCMRATGAAASRLEEVGPLSLSNFREVA